MVTIGLIGVGTMGRNLALNLARHGCEVMLYDRDLRRVRDLIQHYPEERLREATTLQDFVQCLCRPRCIWLMVNPGKPIDQLLKTLQQDLQPGDVIIDGGNSHYKDTERRSRSLVKRGIYYLGVGVSGGAEGALHGPSLMVGGDLEGYQSIEAVLTSIAAKASDGAPCVAYLGKGGAGHYVKMVHNGIEYALMQAIAEVYDFLTRLVGFSIEANANIFEQFHRATLRSYLIEITIQVLRRRDPEDGQPLLEKVLDKAEQKGTGMWSVQEGLQRGVPLPGITQAVEARFLSTMKEERLRAAQRLPRTESHSLREQPWVEITQAALEACFRMAYVHGFSLLSAGAQAHGYGFSLAEVARIWRAGCIIRSAILEDIYSIFCAEREQTNLLLTEQFRQQISSLLPGWRKVVGLGVSHGVPLPVMGAMLAFYDGYRSERLPAHLIQALRDRFGGHMFERTDRPGRFHMDWRSNDETACLG